MGDSDGSDEGRTRMNGPLGDPDLRVQREAELSDLAADLCDEGLLESVPSDAEFVRYVDPDERKKLETQYMKDNGFDVRETINGFKLNARTTNEQEEADQDRAVAEARYRLEVIYPVHPRYRGPRSERQLNILYDYYVEQLVPCLREAGYDVGPLPTRYFFLANQSPLPWSPYNNVGPQDVHLPKGRGNWWAGERLLAYEALQKRCPPTPPIAVLFPDEDA